MKKTNFKRYLFLVLIVVWMAVIFIFSSQQGNESASLSSSFTYFLIYIIDPGFADIDANTQLEILDTVHFIIRKCAHMTEYAILWCLLYQFLKTYSMSSKKCFILALLFSFVYAGTDEFHQSFIPGRGPSFTDVLIDTSGAMIFGVLYQVIEKICKKRKTIS